MHLPLAGTPDFATWQPFLDEIISHPTPDPFRARHNFRNNIDIPGFHVTSWFDIFQTSVIAAFQDIQARTGTQKLWVGPNEHYFVYADNFWPRDPYFEWFGYWLKAEFSKEPFDIGTFAACHGEDPDSGACRFFMTLSKAPFLDGHFTVFGKVTSGLDVARRIFTLPVRNDPAYPEGDRPEKAVVIRTVTIETSEAGAEWQTLSGQ